ncbi:MAG: NAD(P)-dependent oxidoreductase [Pseudomonadota bacterium]
MLLDQQDTHDLTAAQRDGIDAETRRVGGGAGMRRRVLLVGGSGYIGCPVAGALLAAGADVVNLDRLVYHHGSAMLALMAHPNYRFIAGDMGDADALGVALEGVTDVVILGGLVGDPITKAFPEEAGRVNDEAILACIDRLDGQGLNKVIFVSTCSNYGMIPDDAKADETFELSPLSLYAKSKVAAEQHLLGKSGSVDYAPTVLRFATAFGLAPRMRFDLTVNEFTRELAVGNELLVFDAHTWRPYCHVQDFARLIARVLSWPVAQVSGEVFNAGGDENNHTKQSIVDLILKRIPDGQVAYKENSSDPRNYRVDFAKVRDRLGFTPRVSVGDGVDEIIWAIGRHMLDDVPVRRNFYGNYALPGLA